MRLVALLLTAACLGAQAPQVKGPRPLPWQSGPTPPWEPLGAFTGAPSGPEQPLVPSTGPVQVRLSPDGTLEVYSGAEVRSLRLGLPGRPLKVWRDGGIPVSQPWDRLAFPQADPLSEGLGGLAWNAGDFRPSLAGLLWILEDGERVLTVVHPATAQVAFIPLPRGEGVSLAFEPSRLVARAGQGGGEKVEAWTLPWLALLPQFARLGPPSGTEPHGTALKPFPASQTVK
ncbi:MAG: hypothetical protein JST05_06500 [Acidobacteria bacterium]|nr:hypothetical protein [Acidobacteriota bacterium]